jgi:L-asparaginase
MAAEAGEAGRVLVLALGGTISMTSDGREAGARPTLAADALLDGLPFTATVESRDLRIVPSAQLTLADLWSIADAIGGATGEGFAGVVVVQGTDTIEDIAFGLDLLVADDWPTVVVTGAMRPAVAPGADGPANLVDAVATAAGLPLATEIGVLVVLGGEIHSASLVRKGHTSAPHAFTSWPGAIGDIAEGEPRLLLRPAVRRRLPAGQADGRSRHPDVAVLTATLGDDRAPLARLLTSPPDGLVVEGFGVGHVPLTWLPDLTELAQAIPVILCSRTRTGPMWRRTYGFDGSERDLLARNLIPGGGLDMVKATVALRLLLARHASRDEIGRCLQGQPV